MSSIHILSVLLAGGTATLSLLLGTAAADCLVEGDMVFVEGQSTGHLGLECLNSTHYDAVDTVCGPDEVLIEIDAVYACPAPDPASDPFGLYAAPYCVQCGPRGPGSALCLVAPEVPSYCASGATGGGDAGTDDEEEQEDSLPAETTTATTSATSVVISSFDQCESESDVSIWTASGGEAYLAARSNYCSAKYDGGCGLEDAECISSCFEENYGYTAQCAACFGSLPLCTYTMGCMEAWSVPVFFFMRLHIIISNENTRSFFPATATATTTTAPLPPLVVSFFAPLPLSDEPAQHGGRHGGGLRGVQRTVRA